MTSKSEQKLAEVEALQARLGALRDRVAAGCYVTGVPPTDISVATFLEARPVVEDAINEIARLRELLTADGNLFMSGFTLWMARRNTDRLEGLIDKAEKQRRAAIAARENETQ